MVHRQAVVHIHLLEVHIQRRRQEVRHILHEGFGTIETGNERSIKRLDMPYGRLGERERDEAHSSVRHIICWSGAREL